MLLAGIVNKANVVESNFFFENSPRIFFVLFPGLGGSALHAEIFTISTLFGRMPGIEPELLRPQPGVLTMSYTHPYELHTSH